MTNRFYVTVMTAILLSFSATGYAGDYLKQVGAKFGRGVQNIVTSPAEIPCSTETQMKKGDRIVGFLRGIGVGTGLFLRRAAIGVYEVVGTPVPSQPILSVICKSDPGEVLL